mgnify:CR=1 FL=1|jgi:hypothetical protein
MTQSIELIETIKEHYVIYIQSWTGSFISVCEDEYRTGEMVADATGDMEEIKFSSCIEAKEKAVELLKREKGWATGYKILKVVERYDAEGDFIYSDRVEEFRS